MQHKTIYLFDATAFCYRAFYALRQLSTSFGQSTNAVYGFTMMLKKIMKEKAPEYAAVCFDVSRDTFRQKKFAEYKMNRPPMPDGLVSQIPLIKQIIQAYGIAIFEKAGFEADDIIATLTRKAGEMGLHTVIISSDKDILQLVDEHTLVFSPYKDEGLIYDREKVKERYGVEPTRIADIIALMGDEVDNIPGVPGIGEKTAIALLSEFGSLEALLKDIDRIKQEKAKRAILGSLERVLLSKELACLDSNVGLDFDLERLRVATPNTKELFRLFKYLEFKSLLRDLPQEEEVSVPAVSVLEDAELEGLLRNAKELFVYGSCSDDLRFHVGEKSFTASCAAGALRAILSDAGIKKTGHDLKKIKVALAQDGVLLDGLSFDTMIAAYLLNPSKSTYNLSDVAWDYLGIAATTLSADNAIDVVRRLKPRLEEELREKSLTRLFAEIEMPLAGVLARMELNGVTVDRGVLKELSQDIEKRLEALIREIYDTSGCEFNINSTKQLRSVLFEKLKLPVVRRGKTGPSTDEEVLRTLAAGHRLPALLLEYRQLTKLKNTYIDVLPALIDEKTGRLHTSFNQAATETGRLSSSNPNLQNIPVKTEYGRKVRRAVVCSGENYWLLSCDYSQIELRILAHLSKDDNLISAFQEDRDIHRLTASLIYGVSEEDIADAQREVAKRVNFGIVYGLTSYGLSRDLGILVDDAQRFIDAYFARYPKVYDYIQEQIARADEDGFVTTLLGRRRYIPDIKDKNQGIRQFAQRQAVNTPIQGSASDLIKLAMIQIDSQIQGRGLKTQMLLQIHDELVFDVLKRELEEVTALVRDRMEHVLPLDVPIKVDIKKGKNWLEMEDIA